MAERDQAFIHKYRLLLGLSAVAAAVVLAMHDKSFTGATVFLGAVVTLIATVIWAQKASKQDTESRQE